MPPRVVFLKSPVLKAIAVPLSHLGTLPVWGKASGKHLHQGRYRECAQKLNICSHYSTVTVQRQEMACAARAGATLGGVEGRSPPRAGGCSSPAAAGRAASKPGG